MKTKPSTTMELDERLVKLLEEAYIAGWRFHPEDECAKAFRKRFSEEGPAVYAASLLLAAIDDARAQYSVTADALFRHASLKKYLERAKELLEKKD